MAAFTYTFIGLTPEEIDGVALEPGAEVTYPTEVDHPRLLPTSGAVPVLDNSVIEILNALHGTSVVPPTVPAPVDAPADTTSSSSKSTNSTPDTTTSTDAATTDAATTDTTSTESN